MKTTMKKVTNEYGVEYQFTAKLINIGATILKNSNNTEYVIGTIEFAKADGEIVQRSAMIYKKSLDKGMAVGADYLSTMRIGDDNQVYLTCSALSNASRANLDDFLGMLEEETVATTETTEVGQLD